MIPFIHKKEAALERAASYIKVSFVLDTHACMASARRCSASCKTAFGVAMLMR